MKPKERVLAALRHEETDRVPVDIPHGQILAELEARLRLHFGVNDTTPVLVALGVDTRWIRPVYKRPADGGPATAGLNLFGAADGLMSYADGVGARPLQGVETVAEVENYPWPDASAYDFEVAAILAEDNYRYATVAGHWNPIFCRICELCGMEHALTLMLDKPAVVEAMVERITAFNVDYARRLLAAVPNCDIYYTGDDVCGQYGPLMRPDLLKRYFLKPFAQVYDVVHSFGKYGMFHLCGAAASVVPDLIEVGVDILQVMQMSAAGMDARKLKAEFGDHIVFWGAIDEQHTLPYGTPAEVRAEVRDRIVELGKGGGYVLGSSHSLLDDVPVANVIAMFDEARIYRPWGRRRR
ncbi:MAG: uroporphyrinogen decarboxylase family protein [Chloroflexota bacterium]